MPDIPHRIISSRAVLFLVLINLLIYSNTFDATWHFDDFSNIINNENIHLKDLTTSSIYNAFFVTNNENETRLYRPVSCLSLALNWYFGQNNVWGYHLVNILIHCLTTVFLYFFIIHVLALPRINIQNKEKIYFIALLSTVLWAINPIHTQAITYIIQRMASLAGMFYILTLLFYIRMRCYSPATCKKIVNFAGTMVCLILAVFSKENAALVSFSIVLVESIFIQDLSDSKTRKKMIIGFGAALLVVLFVGIFVFLKGDPLSFLDGYQKRPFTFFQRILTEPRIILFYLSLIIYPVPTRLNLDHDVIVSTSFLSPWSTLLSILLIIFLIFYSIYKIKSRPILSFSILFFFLNHSIESSILPLELIFEHRNYIPSMFLFIPVSLGFYQLVEYYREKNIMYSILVCFGILIVVGFGMSTYIRNMAWFSEKRLWEDCIEKNPNSIRSYHNLAWGHYEKINDHGKAIKLYKKAVTMKNNANTISRFESYKNIAYQYFKQKKYSKAETYWNKSLEIVPNERSYAGLSLVNAKRNNIKKALYFIDQAIIYSSVNDSYFKVSSNDFFLIKGKLLLQNSDASSALKVFQKSLKLSSTPAGYIGMGMACTLNGFSDRGLWFFKQAERIKPFNTSFYVYFADHFFKTGDLKNAKKQIRKYLLATPFKSIQAFLMKLNSDLLTFPVHKGTFKLINDELSSMYSNLKMDSQNNES